MDHKLLLNHLHDVKRRLVLFDFDGTITTHDTLLEFIKFYHGTPKFLMGFALHSPWIGLMFLKVIPNWKTKQKVLQWFFSGVSTEEFNKKSEAFCETVVPRLVRPKALIEIEKHRAEGSTVVVVSASAENWIRPWCKKYDLNCIATQLEEVDNKLTGKIKGVNCYGPEKEHRIRACYTLSDYDEVIAYGDSKGDLEMLALAKQQFYRPFRD
jgi:phosphatidylglycerophosphatase C